jgi:hypothetical protein
VVFCLVLSCKLLFQMKNAGKLVNIRPAFQENYGYFFL